MTRFLILMCLVVVTGCSGGRYDAPPNLDNACAMKSARPAMFKDLARVERKWGVPNYVILAMIHQESKFVPNARTPIVYKLGVIPWGRMSSAYGYSQALDGTWEWYQKETGNRRAERDDFGDATDFMGWYMNETRKRNGVALHDAYNQYLAYHEGHTGFQNRSYRSKAWLPPVARRVQERAVMYSRQLSRCR